MVAWRHVAHAALRFSIRRRALARRRTPEPAEETVDQDARELLDALAQLPLRQRSVVVLRFYEQLTQQEIADALDLRLGTVNSSLHRGLANLRGDRTMTDQPDPNEHELTEPDPGQPDPSSSPAESPELTERRLTARLDRAAGRVRGGAVTEASVAARVTTRARHRRQVRAGVGAVAAALLLVVGISVANRGGDNGETVRVAGPPPSSSVPESCGTAALGAAPHIVVPHEVALDSAIKLSEGDQFTLDQARAVLAGQPLVVTDAQASYLRQHGLDPAHPTTTTTVPPPSLEPGQTPFDAEAEAFREAGLLTPEQEAQIKAGQGITLTPEESALFEERFQPGGPLPEIQRSQLRTYVAAVEASQRAQGAAPDQSAPPQSSRPCPTTDTSAPPVSPRCPPERSIAGGSMEPWLDKQPDGSFVLSDDGARLLDIMGILRSAQRRTIADGKPVSIKSLDGEQLVKLSYLDLADIDGSMKALPAFLFSDQQATDLRTFLQTLLRSCNRDKPTFSTGEPEGVMSTTTPTEMASTTTG